MVAFVVPVLLPLLVTKADEGDDDAGDGESLGPLLFLPDAARFGRLGDGEGEASSAAMMFMFEVSSEAVRFGRPKKLVNVDCRCGEGPMM